MNSSIRSVLNVQQVCSLTHILPVRPRTKATVNTKWTFHKHFQYNGVLREVSQKVCCEETGTLSASFDLLCLKYRGCLLSVHQLTPLGKGDPLSGTFSLILFCMLWAHGRILFPEHAPLAMLHVSMNCAVVSSSLCSNWTVPEYKTVIYMGAGKLSV